MLVVDVSLAEPGMQLLREVRDEKGSTLVKKDAVLTREIIDKLKASEARFLLIKTHPDEKDPGYGGLSFGQSEYLKDKVYDIMEYLSFSRGLSKESFRDFADQITATTESLFALGSVLREMKVIEFYDDYTYQHSVGVMVTSLLLAKKLEEKGIRKFTAKEKLSLALGSLLHDIGKATIDKNITNKPGKLTDEEFEEMKKHPVHGKVLMRRLRPMIEAALGDAVDMSVVEQIVGCHHLRPDGKGYGIDPETDVIPKRISEIHEVLSRSQSLDGKVKITASGKVFREQEGKDIPIFGGKSRKGDDEVLTETSVKAFMFQLEKEMGKSLEGKPATNDKLAKISDLVWIVGMADAYDAMVSDRSYRLGMHPVKVLKIIEEERNKQFYSPFVDAFKEIVVDYPVGSVVLFRDGNIGVVTEAQKNKGECEIIASLFGDIDAVGTKKEFDHNDVFLGVRRLQDLEKELAQSEKPLPNGSPVMIAAKDELASFIEKSIPADAIEKVLSKIEPTPVIAGSRETLAKVMKDDVEPELERGP